MLNPSDLASLSAKVARDRRRRQRRFGAAAGDVQAKPDARHKKSPWARCKNAAGLAYVEHGEAAIPSRSQRSDRRCFRPFVQRQNLHSFVLQVFAFQSKKIIRLNFFQPVQCKEQ